MERVAALLIAAGLGLAPVADALARDGGKVTKTFEHALPNVPGKSMIAVLVEYPPGGGSPSHRHAPSGFIMAYVLSGQIRSQVDGEPARVYKPGETWYEAPGAHHVISENASSTEPATLLAVFVVQPGEALTTFDR